MHVLCAHTDITISFWVQIWRSKVVTSGNSTLFMFLCSWSPVCNSDFCCECWRVGPSRLWFRRGAKQLLIAYLRLLISYILSWHLIATIGRDRGPGQHNIMVPSLVGLVLMFRIYVLINKTDRHYLRHHDSRIYTALMQNSISVFVLLAECSPLVLWLLLGCLITYAVSSVQLTKLASKLLLLKNCVMIPQWATLSGRYSMVRWWNLHWSIYM